MEVLTSFINYLIAFIPQVLQALVITLQVFGGTLLLSLPLGILVALCRLSKFKPLSALMNSYILIMRGTPLLLQIIFFYFGFGAIKIPIPRMPAVLLAFVLNYAAYFAEIFRAGISSIDKGQYEGAEVLGLSNRDIFFRIILPQAFKRVLPPVGNEIITLVKDTALVNIVGFNDLMKLGKGACNRDASLVPLIIIGIVYLMIVCILTTIMNRVEKNYNYYQ